MIVLAIADRPPKNNILETIKKYPVDLIMTLGDLDFFDIRNLEKITNIPKIGIYGNHCTGTYMESLGIENLHLKTKEIGGLVFGGFEGSLKYKESSCAKMYTQEEASELLKDFPTVDCLIAHAPPYGINDEVGDPTHEGFIAIRDYIERQKPKYFFHGHTYPTQEDLIIKYIDTDIIYVYQDRLIKLY